MTSSLSSKPIELTVESRAHGWRVDYYLSRLFPNYSRQQFKHAIEQQVVLVNGLPVKSARRLRVNDCIEVRLPKLPERSLPPEDIPLDILHEDNSIVIINKPAGMIVHPGKGNYGGTLAGALQFHFDQLSNAAGKFRPGIVHRLDRDTSGVLVLAKNNQVHAHLSGQFERREVGKEYQAIAWGVFELESDYIETYMRVHPKSREKMQVCRAGGNARDAITFYEVIEQFGRFTHVRLKPHTGRTHQLRVHLQYLGHPIVADRPYGGQAALRHSDLLKSSKARVHETDEPSDCDTLIARQALHAYRLKFCHPESGQSLTFEAPLPKDFQAALNALRQHKKEAS